MVVFGFLLGLPSAVPTLTVLVFRNPDEFPIPIDPFSGQVRELAGPEAEATREQTNQSCLKSSLVGELFTGFEQPFELSIGEGVLMGVAGDEVSAVTVRPVSCFESIGSHRTLQSNCPP